MSEEKTLFWTVVKANRRNGRWAWVLARITDDSYILHKGYEVQKDREYPAEIIRDLIDFRGSEQEARILLHEVKSTERRFDRAVGKLCAELRAKPEYSPAARFEEARQSQGASSV